MLGEDEENIDEDSNSNLLSRMSDNEHLAFRTEVISNLKKNLRKLNTKEKLKAVDLKNLHNCLLNHELLSLDTSTLPTMVDGEWR